MSIEEIKRKAAALDWLEGNYHQMYDIDGDQVIEAYGVAYRARTVLEAVEKAMEAENEG